MPRVYVETTVWSFAFADDSPDMTAATLEFFEACRAGEFDPVISPLVLLEVADADPSKRAQLESLIAELKPEVVTITPDTRRLIEAFLRHRAVPPSKPEDAGHVAAAFTGSVDVLVSWNFKHIASVRRADRFNAVALLEGFSKPLIITTPGEVLDVDEEA